ncbi:hypothetical protein [Bacillus wiedmannii]|uniref:hypothetical protein n=1 Tax=Bacillus wiedmannii TaxID=1890302 RepID=UPI0015CF602D|nr:hypothetical protein [Bacillus wiedmannii]
MGLAVLRMGHLTILTDLPVIPAGLLQVRMETLPTLADQEAGTNEITISLWRW